MKNFDDRLPKTSEIRRTVRLELGEPTIYESIPARFST